MKYKRFLPDFLLLALALAAAGAVFLLRPAAKPVVPAADLAAEQAASPLPREVTITLRAAGLEAPTQEKIDPSALIGCALDTGDAVIEDCCWETYSESVWTADGETVYAPDPARRDLVVTLSAQMAGEPPVFLLAGQEIRMGRGFFLSAGPLYLPMTITGFSHP